MGWNYRLFKHTDKNPNHKEGSDITSEYFVWYGIHEVFYKNDESDELNENEVDLISVDPIPSHGATKDEIEEDLNMQLAAIDKPVLDYNQILEKLKNG